MSFGGKEKVVDRKILVSHESLLSTGFRPVNYAGSIRRSQDFRDTAEKIKAVADAAGLHIKPIITVRRQDALMFSYYAERHYVYRQVTPALPTFDQYIDYMLGVGYHSFGGALLDFESVIAVYEQLFGSDNVCILVYEMMERDPESFFGKLAAFLGVDSTPWINEYQSANLKNPDSRENARSISTTKRKARTSHGNLYTTLSRVKKRFFGSTSFGIAKRAEFLKGIRISRETRIETKQEKLQILRNHFATSNQKLDDRLGLGLSDFGYY